MKQLLVLVVGAVLLSASPARGAEGDFWVGAQGGRSAPAGDLDVVADPGWEGGLLCKYMESEHRGVGVDVAYHSWRTNSVRQFPLAGTGVRLETSGIQANASAFFEFPASRTMSPFASAGFGVNWIKTNLVFPGPLVLEGNREINAGVTLGAGVNVHVDSRNAFGVVGTYQFLSSGGYFTLGLSLTSRRPQRSSRSLSRSE